jgi:regulatory protein
MTPLANAKAGRNYCIRLLSRREYSAAKLREKLLARELSLAEAEEIISALVAQGIQSDFRCAEAIQRGGASKGWSKRRLQLKMRSQGIDLETLPDFELLEESAERERSKMLFERWLSRTDGSREARRKVLARLARRGFPIGHLF